MLWTSTTFTWVTFLATLPTSGDKWNHESCDAPKSPERTMFNHLSVNSSWNQLQQAKTHQQVHLWQAKEKTKWRLSRGPSQSPKSYWDWCGRSLKRCSCWKPSNVAELKGFCKDEWKKIPPQPEKTHCKLSQIAVVTGWANL